MPEQPIDLAPFDMLTQKDQWSHLRQFHTWQLINNLNSKSRKDQFQAAHEGSHLRDENVGTPHTHTAVAALGETPGDPLAGKDMEAVDLSKPLNLTQRRALKDLVENDFLTMRAELQQMADDTAADRRRDITKEWAERGSDADAFKRLGQKLLDAYRDGTAALVAEAAKAGVEVKLPKVKDAYPSLEATTPGLQAAIRDAEAEVKADLNRALNTLERSRLTAQRKVLLTGVTQEALDVLDQIPTAKQLMVQAAAERAGQNSIEGATK